MFQFAGGGAWCICQAVPRAPAERPCHYREMRAQTSRRSLFSARFGSHTAAPGAVRAVSPPIPSAGAAPWVGTLQVPAPLAASPSRGRSNLREEVKAGKEPNPRGTELLILPAALRGGGEVRALQITFLSWVAPSCRQRMSLGKSVGT